MSGALIVTVEIAPPDLSWLDRLRRLHYPPERNQLPAHLTMFHALPPSAEGGVRRSLGRLAAERPPRASIDGVMDLGGGVAFRIVSPELDAMRRELAANFRGLLSAQDSGGWRPHVTIQNKVAARDARQLLEVLERDFRPKPLGIAGLGLHRYLGGPWEPIERYAFRGR
ncbi:MAG: 2'-5' RNA ligase family protein [Pseudomonadota bacterium]